MTSLSSFRKELAGLNRRVGKDPLLVQAAGGNASVKVPAEDALLIKATGFRLKETSAHQGLTVADLPTLKKGLSTIRRLPKRQREMAYATLIGESSPPPQPRASMEAGFHAVLPNRWVVHVHSVAGILIGMLPEPRAKQWLRAALPGVPVHFVGAKMPGFELTQAMHDIQIAAQASRPVELWVQRNHGLVWSCSDRTKLQAVMAQFERRLRKLLTLDQYPAPHPWKSRACLDRSESDNGTGVEAMATTVCFCRWPQINLMLKPLFPDFVIYFSLVNGQPTDLRPVTPFAVRIEARSPAQRKDKEEVLTAHLQVATLAAEMKILKLLPSAPVRQIKKLETERLRMKRTHS